MTKKRKATRRLLFFLLFINFKLLISSQFSLKGTSMYFLYIVTKSVINKYNYNFEFHYTILPHNIHVTQLQNTESG